MLEVVSVCDDGCCGLLDSAEVSQAVVSLLVLLDFLDGLLHDGAWV